MQNNEDLVLAYADALVELKRGKSPLNQGQLLLQLTTASLMSNKKNGVVLLGMIVLASGVSFTSLLAIR